MSPARQNNYACFLLRLTLLLTLALNFTAQAQEEETKTNEPKTGAISGRVVNENGQPIPHATVYVSASSSRALPPRITATDDAGNFQVAGLDASLYFVSATAPSYSIVARDAGTPAPNYRIGDNVTLSLIKGGVISGMITSATGEPMVQVGVRAQLIRDASGQPPLGRGFPIDKTTDDRGIYRIYGLPPGTYLVSAGGRGNAFSYGAYDSDAPTFAPSSTRDTAAEIVVRAAEETSGIDIRYRGEPGHAISGIVSGPSAPNLTTNIVLTQAVNGPPQILAFSYQPPNSKGFAFYGVADGEYDLIAQAFLGPGDQASSEARHITVKGADVTGVELAVKALASVTGRVTLETSTAPECKNKRQPLLSETLVIGRRSEKATPQNQLALQGFSVVQSMPDKSGDFTLRNLGAGQFNVETRFFAKYWYLRSLTRQTAAEVSPRTALANRSTDVARTGVALKFGERITGLTVTLAEGAASLRGAVKPAEGETVPPKLLLHLVPAEKESADDALRFFSAPVNSDATFAINNLPPGRYWALARVVGESESRSSLDLRVPEAADQRTQVRRAAEAAKISVEFKPCQNLTNYELLFNASPAKTSGLKGLRE